jgi:hypothetical protein
MPALRSVLDAARTAGARVIQAQAVTAAEAVQAFDAVDNSSITK